MKNRQFTIALDGPAGAGKSTVAKAIAEKLGMHHLDSGALFRAIALKAIRRQVDTHDERALSAILSHTDLDIRIVDGVQHTYLDGEDVNGLIRTQQVGKGASDIGTILAVRTYITERVRAFAKSNLLIVDGRDIGSVMLPDAEYKFFLTASVEERAKRRLHQLKEQGETDVDLIRIVEEIRSRDEQDSTRSIAPLIQAKDAVVIDSTSLSVEEVVAAVLSHIERDCQHA